MNLFSKYVAIGALALGLGCASGPVKEDRLRVKNSFESVLDDFALGSKVIGAKRVGEYDMFFRIREGGFHGLIRGPPEQDEDPGLMAFYFCDIKPSEIWCYNIGSEDEENLVERMKHKVEPRYVTGTSERILRREHLGRLVHGTFVEIVNTLRTRALNGQH